MSLLSINVNEHTERKNGLTYLSWAWAWAEVLKVDPEATWDVIEHDGMPVRFLPDRTAMVKVAVGQDNGVQLVGSKFSFSRLDDATRTGINQYFGTV